MKRSEAIALLGASAAGFTLHKVDSSPGWDSTAITAGLIFISAGVLSELAPRWAWAIALLTGGWISLFGIGTGNYGALLALAVGFFGAVSGRAASLALQTNDRKEMTR